MPVTAPINLTNGLQNGILRDILLANTGHQGPEPGKHWLVLAGLIGHVTGTATFLYQRLEYSTGIDIYKLAGIAAAMPTGGYPLHQGISVDATPTAPVQLPNDSLFILCDTDQFIFTGDAAATCHVRVLEW